MGNLVVPGISTDASDTFLLQDVVILRHKKTLDHNIQTWGWQHKFLENLFPRVFEHFTIKMTIVLATLVNETDFFLHSSLSIKKFTITLETKGF